MKIKLDLDLRSAPLGVNPDAPYRYYKADRPHSAFAGQTSDEI